MNKAIVLFMMTAVVGAAAAPFQNLGFDDGNTNNTAPGSWGLPSDLVPAWQIINGAAGPVPIMGFDSAPFGPPESVADVFLLSPNNPNQYPVSGKFSLLLVPAYPSPVQSTASISQIGDIPSDAKRIEFINFLSSFELRVNGNLIPLAYEIFPGSQYPSGVGDISGYAGQTVELKFTTIPFTVPPPFELDRFYHGIDNIRFSPELIPEPSTWALLAIGGIALLLRRMSWKQESEVRGFRPRQLPPAALRSRAWKYGTRSQRSSFLSQTVSPGQSGPLSGSTRRIFGSNSTDPIMVYQAAANALKKVDPAAAAKAGVE